MARASTSTSRNRGDGEPGAETCAVLREQSATEPLKCAQQVVGCFAQYHAKRGKTNSTSKIAADEVDAGIVRAGCLIVTAGGHYDLKKAFGSTHPAG